MTPATVSTPSDTKIEVVRRFEGPVDLVWKSFAETEMLRQWMVGPPGWSMPVCEMDFRVGGSYENVFRNESDGLEIGIVGTFREIEAHRKIVQDEKHVIGSSPESATNETVVTITFNDSNASTTVTTLIEYASKAARDEALATGMGEAMEIGYCRIDELLASRP